MFTYRPKLSIIPLIIMSFYAYECSCSLINENLCNKTFPPRSLVHVGSWTVDLSKTNAKVMSDHNNRMTHV